MKTGSLFSGFSIPVYNNNNSRPSSRNGLRGSSNPGNSSDRDNLSARTRRNRVRKISNNNHNSIKSLKNMSKKSKGMDFTDYAYREAVNRLKFLLAESYVPTVKSGYLGGKHMLDESGDDTDNQSGLDRPPLSDISKYLSPATSNRGARNTARKLKQPPYSTTISSKENVQTPTAYTTVADYLKSPQHQDTVQAPPEILNFIEKQEDYIEQLEKESKFCRDELSSLLGKVKDVISENEALTEHARSDVLEGSHHSHSHSHSHHSLMSCSSDSEENTRNEKCNVKKRTDKSPAKHYMNGPSIVFESRISELEAEIAQYNIDLKKLRQENDELKRKIAYGGGGSANVEAYRKQIEGLQRDKSILEDTIRRLEVTIDDLKSEGRFTTSKRRDLADLALFEKSQAEMEIKHLREELERQHERVRELQHEMARRVAEERANAERRYNYQVDQLGGDLSTQWEQAAKLQMDLERQKRIETDLKRDLQQRNAQIEEMKMELKTKRTDFLSELAQVNAEKQSLEQEITSLRLQLERADRQSKIEASRLNAEITSLRQRLDRADADILHGKRENLRLMDEVAALEKEVAIGDMKNEARPTRSDMNKMILDIQEKHAGTVNELEEMIQNQRQLMDKLTTECKSLTNKLEDTTLKHNKEKRQLYQINVVLMDRLQQLWFSYKGLRSEFQKSNENIREEQNNSQQTMILKPLRLQQAEHFPIQEETDHQSPKLPRMISKHQSIQENPNQQIQAKSQTQTKRMKDMNHTETMKIKKTISKRAKNVAGEKSQNRSHLNKSHNNLRNDSVVKPQKHMKAKCTAQQEIMINIQYKMNKDTEETIIQPTTDMTKSNMMEENTQVTTTNHTKEKTNNTRNTDKTMINSSTKRTLACIQQNKSNSHLDNSLTQAQDCHIPEQEQDSHQLVEQPLQQQHQHIHDQFPPPDHSGQMLRRLRSSAQVQHSPPPIYPQQQMRKLLYRQEEEQQVANCSNHLEVQLARPRDVLNRERAAALWGYQIQEEEEWEEQQRREEIYYRNSPPRDLKDYQVLQESNEIYYDTIDPLDLIPEPTISSPSLFELTSTEDDENNSEQFSDLDSSSRITVIQRYPC